MRNIANHVKSSIKWLKLNTKKGTAAIEYGLLASLIALAIIAGVNTVGGNLKGVFNSVASQVHS